MTWQPTTVTLRDGRQVLSDSEDWRAECEAIHRLRQPYTQREASLAMVEKVRGLDARLALERHMREVEPAFILDMANKDVRRAYLGRVEHHRGLPARESLEADIRALFARRKADALASSSECAA